MPFAIANAMYAIGRYDYDRGADEACIRRLRETIVLCEVHEVRYLDMASKAIVGLLTGRQGDIVGGLALVRECITWNRATEALTFVPNYLGMEAELLARGGEVTRGLACMQEAFDLMTESGSAWEQAGLLRQRGEILRLASRNDEAEADLRAAVTVAEAQEATLFRLRATMPLAELLAATGRSAEGYDMLAAALRPFAQEAEPVILQAREVLSRLVSTADRSSALRITRTRTSTGT
jgi:predicted ATPase